MLPAGWSRYSLTCSLCPWTSGYFWVPEGADPPKRFQEQGARHAWEAHPDDATLATGKSVPPWERGQPGTPG